MSVSVAAVTALVLIEKLDNITYYKCDVSQWSEVEAVAKRIKEEVRCLVRFVRPKNKLLATDWRTHCPH